MAASDAKKKAIAKYNLKAYDRVELKVKKGKKEIIKAHAEQQGESLNAFINRAIDTQIKSDIDAQARGSN